MLLIDTSIWIDFLNKGDDAVSHFLIAEQVVMHPHVYGEIALGSLKNRGAQLQQLRDLHRLAPATDAEVFAMIEWQKLWGTGVGLSDAHLLASVLAADPELELLIWTRDGRLKKQAERLDIAYAP